MAGQVDSESLSLEVVDELVEIARNLRPPIRPSVYNGKEYYWLHVGVEQAGNVVRGEVVGLGWERVTADVREDGSWTVVLLDADGAPVLFCHPDFFCEHRGCTIEELMAMVGLNKAQEAP